MQASGQGRLQASGVLDRRRLGFGRGLPIVRLVFAPFSFWPASFGDNCTSSPDFDYLGGVSPSVFVCVQVELTPFVLSPEIAVDLTPAASILIPRTWTGPATSRSLSGATTDQLPRSR